MKSRLHSSLNGSPASGRGSSSSEGADGEHKPSRARAAETEKSFLAKHGVTIALVAVMLIGVGIFLYPIASNYINSLSQSYAVANYQDAVESTNQDELDQMLAKAQAWNAELAYKGGSLNSISGVELDEYNALLNIEGINVMGYIEIDKINVRLPIYHSTGDDALAIGVGHLEGSSLPVGGESTHCVLMAHRGLPTSMLFTDLDRLEVGDTFAITVLAETRYYEVDQVLIVEPDDLSALHIEEGQDLCTLVTCTPYGVNTQRLLVRGHRTSAPNSDYGSSDARIVDGLVVATVITAVLILALVVGLVIWTRTKKKRVLGPRR